MALSDFLAELDALARQAAAAFEKAEDSDAVEAARVEFLGAKSGRLKTVQKGLGKVDKADKPEAGKRFNQVKKELPYQIILQFPSYLRETALVSAFNQHMEPALKGAISFDRALKNLAEQINSVIAKEM